MGVRGWGGGGGGRGGGGQAVLYRSHRISVGGLNTHGGPNVHCTSERLNNTEPTYIPDTLPLSAGGNESLPMMLG